MKKSSETIIFLGFVLGMELIGAVTYRALVNDNPRRQEGGSTSNEDKARNGHGNFGSLGGGVDTERVVNGMLEKEGEEQIPYGIGKSEYWKQSGVDQNSDENVQTKIGLAESGKQNSLSDTIANSSVIEGRGVCSCGEQGAREDEQGGSGENGGMEGTKIRDSGFDDEVEGSGGQDKIKGEDKNPAKKEKSESRQPFSEIGAATGRVNDIEDDLETNAEAEQKGKQGENDTNAGNVNDGSIQTFRFSSLDP